MAFVGAGTRTSPIAIDDDSEEEVINELYNDSADSAKQSPPNGPPMALTQDNRGRFPPMGPFHGPSDSRTTHNDKKRKRANSFTSQDSRMAGPSSGHGVHPSLVQRLSHPESKKARKRRRRAELQAQEEHARLQNIDWLNNATFGSAQPLQPLTFPFWPNFNELSSIPSSFSDAFAYPTSQFGGQAHPPFRSSYEEIPFFQHYTPNSSSSTPPPPSLPPPSPPRTTDWVSSMAMAAENHVYPGAVVLPSSYMSPLSPQAPLPTVLPPPLPPPQAPRMNTILGSKSSEPNSLPHKPPPMQPPANKPEQESSSKHTTVQSIGVMPDPDPNSKRGIFHITASTKEAGTDMKKRPATYMPNPARTLVMEQLPKTHRTKDFINQWSRSACGALPVHLFIDTAAAKALIEFATAELARKAWTSPKLGNYAGLKSHQLKGKPREDLIKVWWYRVVGVGAGAGVGEIEEGEIEGDGVDREIGEITTTPKKETKKEKKVRLAMEREAKRLKKLKKLELRSTDLAETQEQQTKESFLPIDKVPTSLSNSFPMQTIYHNSQLQQPLGTPEDRASPSRLLPILPIRPLYANSQTHQVPTSLPLRAVPLASQFHTAPQARTAWNSSTSRPLQVSIDKATYGASWEYDHDDRESIASSAGRSDSPSIVPHSKSSSFNHAGDLEDYGEDMDVDIEEAPPVYPLQTLPPAPPIHSSLPLRPPVLPYHGTALPQQITASLQPSSVAAAPFVPRSAIQNSSSFPVPRSMPPLTAPQPKLPLTAHSQLPPPAPRVSISTASPSSGTATLANTHLGSTSTTPSTTTPVPSEPKAMKNAPTEPSYTKRALMARQKELEEKIAESKMQLAAAAGSKPTTPAAVQPRPMTSVKPSMDLGEKQAMEDRLRKLVLQSRKPTSKSEVTSPKIKAPPSAVDNLNDKSSTASSTVSVSAHSFSLEDLAVSFISQTIETIKSQPPSVPDRPLPPVRNTSNSNIKSELAAKQKRLEEHISESKALMSQLSQARSKEEKDKIMNIMREKSRLFEDGSRALSEKADSEKTNAVPTSAKTYQSRTTAQQFQINRWPVSHHDAGVLILSDDEDDDDE